MYKTLFFILAFGSVAQAQIESDLKCSANGTVLYYINGVNTIEDDGKVSLANIEKNILKDNEKEFDKNGLIEGVLIHNSTRGLASDVIELYNQATRNLSGQAKKDFFKEMLKEKLSIIEKNNNADSSSSEQQRLEKYTYETFEYIFSKENSNRPINTEGLSKLDLFKIVESLNETIADLLLMTVADVEVINKIKNELTLSHSKHKKIIAVAHSAGNEALRSAIYEYRGDTILFPDINKLADFDDIFGVLHVASPSPVLAVRTGRARAVKLNRDLIIKGASVILPESTIPSTYKYESSNFSGVSKIWLIGPIVEAIYGLKAGVGYHLFDYIYLSDKISASKIGGSGQIDTMKDIFKKNLVEVAESLEDNCLTPIIKISSTNATESNGKMIVDGYAGSGRTISLKVEDIAGGVVANTGYDKKQTTFTYKIVSLPDDELETEQVVDQESDGTGTITLALPYNNLTYTVKITANNNGKESKVSKIFNVPANKPPTASITSSSCSVGQWGENEMGGMKYSIVLNDEDTYGVSGRVINGGSSSRDGAISVIQISDGFVNVGFEIINNCPITYMQYKWEVRASCQTGGCDYSPDPNCSNQTVNTGLQYNKIYVFHPSGESLYRRTLVDGSYGYNYPGSFTDPNDHSQNNIQISFPTGDFCEAGKPNVSTGIETVIMSN